MFLGETEPGQLTAEEVAYNQAALPVVSEQADARVAELEAQGRSLSDLTPEEAAQELAAASAQAAQAGQAAAEQARQQQEIDEGTDADAGTDTDTDSDAGDSTTETGSSVNVSVPAQKESDPAELTLERALKGDLPSKYTITKDEAFNAGHFDSLQAAADKSIAAYDIWLGAEGVDDNDTMATKFEGLFNYTVNVDKIKAGATISVAEGLAAYYAGNQTEVFDALGSFTVEDSASNIFEMEDPNALESDIFNLLEEVQHAGGNLVVNGSLTSGQLTALVDGTGVNLDAAKVTVKGDAAVGQTQQGVTVEGGRVVYVEDQSATAIDAHANDVIVLGDSYYPVEGGLYFDSAPEEVVAHGDFVVKQASDAYVDGNTGGDLKEAFEVAPIDYGSDTINIDLSESFGDVVVHGFILGGGEQADTVDFGTGSEAELLDYVESIRLFEANTGYEDIFVSETRDVYSFEIGFDTNDDGDADSFLTLVDVIGSSSTSMKTDVNDLETSYDHLVGIENLASEIGDLEVSTVSENGYALSQLFAAASESGQTFRKADFADDSTPTTYDGFAQLLGFVGSNFTYDDAA